MAEIITHSPEETIAAAEKLAKRLRPGDMIAFRGGLGAGKTTFTRGLAIGLGLGDCVSSPTFALVNEYRDVKGGGSLTHVSVCTSQDIVGAHALVGVTVAVEILGELLGQRVVLHHAVGTVHPLQLFQLPEHLLVALAAGGKEQEQQEGKNTVTIHRL